MKTEKSISRYECEKIKYQHITLGESGFKLTLAKHVCKDTGIITVGYAVFNKSDSVFTKKKGNELAMKRLIANPLSVRGHISYLNHSYITWLSLLRISMDMRNNSPYYGVKFSDSVLFEVSKQVQEFKRESINRFTETYISDISFLECNIDCQAYFF